MLYTNYVYGIAKLFKYLGIGALAILIFALAILLVPITIIIGIIDIPIKRRRQKRLVQIINNIWIPNKKYIYICYNNKWNLAEYIDSHILQKYTDNVIFDAWDEETSEWIRTFPDEEDRITTIVQDIQGDYDGNFDALISFVDKDKKMIPANTSFLYYQSRKGYVFSETRGEDMPIEDAQHELSEAIEKHIRRWR